VHNQSIGGVEVKMKRLFAFVLFLVMLSSEVLAGAKYINTNNNNNISIGNDNNIFIDESNNRIGIGTKDPERTMHIMSSDYRPIRMTYSPTPSFTADILVIEEDPTAGYAANISSLAFYPGVGLYLKYGSGDDKWSQVVDANSVGTYETDPQVGSMNTNYVCYGGTGSAIVCNDNLYWNPTNDYLGIGLTTPGSKLVVEGGVESERINFTFPSDHTAGMPVSVVSLGWYADTWKIRAHRWSDATISALSFARNDVERMRIDKDGNVGIGTTNPAYPLDVVGQVRVNTTGESQFITGDTYIYMNTVANSYGRIGVYDTSGGALPLVLQPGGGTVEVSGVNSGILLNNTGGGAGFIRMADYSGNPSFQIVTDNLEKYNTMIVNNWGAASNPGVTVGTTRNDGAAFQVVSGVGVTNGLPTTAGTVRMVVNGTGEVGIGLDDPYTDLHIEDTVSGLDYALKLENQQSGSSAGTSGTGILFAGGGSGANERGKGALVYDTTTTWNRGSFHFLQDSGANSLNPDLADIVMTITNSGLVGIGTTVPAENLHINSSEDARIFLTSTAIGTASPGYELGYGTTETGVMYRPKDTSDTRFYINGADRVAIDGSTGYVGIGAIDAVAMLVVNRTNAASNPPISGTAVYGSGAGYGGHFTSTGAATDYGVYAAISDGTNTNIGVFGGTSAGGTTNYGVYGIASGATTNYAGYFINSPVSIGTPTNKNATNINADGDLYVLGEVEIDGLAQATSSYVVYWQTGGRITRTSSSERFKDDIKDYNFDVNKVDELRPVTFRYNNLSGAPGTRTFGLIAEEVVETFPEFVGRDEEGRPDSVAYDHLGVMLIKVVQDQRRQLKIQNEGIETLKMENEQQKQEISELKAAVENIQKQIGN
jgi:hypothetical protein